MTIELDNYSVIFGMLLGVGIFHPDNIIGIISLIGAFILLSLVLASKIVKKNKQK